MTFKKYFLRLLFLVFVLSHQKVLLAAPVPPHSWIESYQKQKEFQYHEVKTASSNSFWDIIYHWIGHIIYLLFYSHGVSTFWKYFPYFLAAIIIGGLFWYLKRYGSNKILERSPSDFITSGLMPENIHELDFASLINDAEKNQNYRWAIRWYYLNYLKQLDERGIIAWATHKTNTNYRREIKSEEQRIKFSQIAHLFEDAWYGEWHVSMSDYTIFTDVVAKPINQQAA